MIRILQCWDQCGISFILNRELRKSGFDCDAIHRRRFDRLNLRKSYPKAKFIRGPAKLFTISLRYYGRNRNIIHLHDIDEYIPFVRKHFKNTKIVLTYHGTKIRNRWKERQHLWKNADAITVTTPDLLRKSPKGTKLIVNPVDSKFFKTTYNLPESKGFIYLPNGADKKSLDIARKVAKKREISLSVLREPFPFNEFPKFMEGFDTYFDIKYQYGKQLPFSLVGLQALAMGLHVYHKNIWFYGLPKAHEVDYVIRRYLEIYSDVISGFLQHPIEER